ncbi:hypothetical protein [Thioalkalivibrio sp. XN279]|uniref:multiheme c-type cytochrome n=1 Tax=Thioalkalivibrio sp. XN279 TaxID=2714953 RepID=UPI001408BDFA|nr:hypothetical protein [Thioalkalivibrio sp. XN279]NHA14910.1 hypothetical protein [Thioalkalivibrio sp. XN279]
MNSKWTMAATIALAAFLGLAGCEGDDGADGAPGAPGTVGPPGPEGPPGESVVTLPLESCAVCHSEGSFASAPAAHAIDGVVSVSDQAFAISGNDLVLSFNVKIDGENAAGLTEYYLTGRFDDIPLGYAFDGDARDLISDVSTIGGGGADGNYTITIANGAVDYATPPVTPTRFFFAITDPDHESRAMVWLDYPSPLPAHNSVSDQACINCHGENGEAGRLATHYADPMGVQQCAVCHVPGASYGDLPYVVHGIHNSHNFPDGVFGPTGRGTTYDVTYPTYMTNCSVCHDIEGGLTAVNAMPVTGEGCFTCHGDMDGFDFTGLEFHLQIADPAEADCGQCHNGSLAGATVAAYHNGLSTGNSGLIWNGADVSVTEAERFTWQITGIVDDGTDVAITWTATYDGNGVNPCNATVAVGAPVFHVPGGGSGGGFSMLRSYAQGDDFIIGTASAPGQAAAVNLTADNTTCTGNVATTIIPADDVDAEVGRVAIQGKPGVVSPASATALLRVRVPTPTFDWVLGTDDAAPARRAVVDTGECLKCHVGSLYQHGGNRVDNVDMCLLCHNSASSEQNVRVGMGVDASEAYDGKAGETFEMKTMLHRVHSAGDVGPAYVIYRNRGIYAWAPDESFLPATWPGTGPQIVFGSDNVEQNHTFHAPTYPRALNACYACHVEGFEVLPDQAEAMATTVDSGEDFAGQIDDTLQGAQTTACITCHTDGATRGHAFQNSWVPQVFPEGRQTIIDAAQ